jgi:hypothetical protein
MEPDMRLHRSQKTAMTAYLSATGQIEGGMITGEVSKAIQSAVFENNRK